MCILELLLFVLIHFVPSRYGQLYIVKLNEPICFSMVLRQSWLWRNKAYLLLWSDYSSKLFSINIYKQIRGRFQQTLQQWFYVLKI